MGSLEEQKYENCAFILIQNIINQHLKILDVFTSAGSAIEQRSGSCCVIRELLTFM